MKIKAQLAMVMNLDKCLGCHTCSNTCKNTWTNRPGAEYMWFNNVETKPGCGYPVEWENQEKYRGGWIFKDNKLELRSGNRLGRLAFHLFHNPYLPTMDDYYEPWTYDYEKLTNSRSVRNQPVARPKSVVTDKYMDLKWGPNWEDDLAGVSQGKWKDVNITDELQEQIRFEYEKTFMAYLPRICEHCLNPGCVASCPSGAIYKREEDGIVLVDQETCRGWRLCTTGCPYKKVYYNWKTQKAEKCIFCFPRIENGQPTICSETCTGRMRYIGVILYDADKVKAAAATVEPTELYQAQLDVFVDPNDPEVEEQALNAGISADWLDCAKSSPIYELAIRHRVALPLHPEFRTLPMVWYIPPLSPLMSAGGKAASEQGLFAALDEMRIPLQYLANILTAGNVQAVRAALDKMLVMRHFMRSVQVGQPASTELELSQEEESELTKLYRLLGVAKYKDRFVIPLSHQEQFKDAHQAQGQCPSSCSGGGTDDV